MKHRLLALLLAACTLLCLVLTSCSKSTDSNQNNSADAATQDTQQTDANGNCLLRAISSSTTRIGSLPSVRASSSTMEAT